MLEPAVNDLAKGKNFAAYTAVLPSGQALTHMIWVDTDGEHLLINTEPQRQKARVALDNPNVTLTIVDAENPYHYAEVRGRIVDRITGDRAAAHIDEVAKVYTGHPYGNPIGPEGRVILVIEPITQRIQGG